MYDVAIIGAGVNGCSVVHAFLQEKKRVVVFDSKGIAAGGSGAAGAFISPKFSKAGELKEIINNAFSYSMEYYAKHFPKAFTQSPLLHIAQDATQDEILRLFKLKSEFPLHESASVNGRESISLDAGIVNAQLVCSLMLEGARFIQESVETLVYDDGMWIINDSYSAKEVVLATGAYKNIIDEPYITLRGVWGHRIDIQTTTQNPYSVHQFVSISPSKDGELAIGATHNVHYHPQKESEPYDVEAGRAELLEKAARSMELQDVHIVKDYMGLRSGSFDYMPLVGSLVLSHETLKCCEKNIRKKKPDYEAFVYYPHLSMINGSGGYGFVLAPYLAKILKEYILEDRAISERISPARFFARWAKRQ